MFHIQLKPIIPSGKLLKQQKAPGSLVTDLLRHLQKPGTPQASSAGRIINATLPPPRANLGSSFVDPIGQGMSEVPPNNALTSVPQKLQTCRKFTHLLNLLRLSYADGTIYLLGK